MELELKTSNLADAVHEVIFGLVGEGQLVVAIDPADVLHIDCDKAGSKLRVAFCARVSG